VFDLDFSEVSAQNDVEANFRDYINTVVRDFSLRYASIIGNVDFCPEDHLASMGSMFRAVKLAGRQVYLIVDEYDSFASRMLLQVDTSAKDLGSAQYLKTVAGQESILRDWGNVIKIATQGPLARAFFTGVTPLAFADGLSSFNIVEDISSAAFTETMFGFTERDIKQALGLMFDPSSAEFAGHFDTLKTNFNGYRFNSFQQESVFNPQMCLYYLKALYDHGMVPDPILDPNMGIPGDNVAAYLISNYRGSRPYSVLSMVLGSFPLKVSHSFRSASLFEESSVNDALVSLAFYHGFLTYADPAGPNAGALVAPNLVFKEIFLQTMFKGIPNQTWQRIMSALAISDPTAKKMALKEVVKEESIAGIAKDAAVRKFIEVMVQHLLDFLTGLR